MPCLKALQVFPKLSVRENLILAGQEHQGSMMSRLFGPSDAGQTEAADRMIAFFGLGHLAAETRFPREDVKALSAEVASLRAQAVASAKADKQLHEDLDKLRQGTAARQAEIERRFVLLTRTFEETVDRLTDNQQIIGGIKAFLRLVQKGGDVARVGSEGGAPGGA